MDLSLVGVQGAGDTVEERRLPGPVRADQPDDLALPDLEGDAVVGREAAEPFREAVDQERDHGGSVGEAARAVGSPPSQRRHGSESRPCGRAAATIMISRPYTTRSMPRPASGPVPR